MRLNLWKLQYMLNFSYLFLSFVFPEFHVQDRDMKPPSCDYVMGICKTYEVSFFDKLIPINILIFCYEKMNYFYLFYVRN